MTRKFEKVIEGLEKHKYYIKTYPYWEDVYQESIIRLLSMGEDYVMQLDGRDELDKYFSRILQSQAFQSGGFVKQKLSDDAFIYFNTDVMQLIPYATDGEFKEPQTIKDDLFIIEKYMNKLLSYTDSDYERNVVQAFLMCRGKTNTRDLTTIPYQEIKRVVDNWKEKLLKDFKK